MTSDGLKYGLPPMTAGHVMSSQIESFGINGCRPFFDNRHIECEIDGRDQIRRGRGSHDQLEYKIRESRLVGKQRSRFLIIGW